MEQKSDRQSIVMVPIDLESLKNFQGPVPGETDLNELSSVLWQNRWLFVSFSFLGILLGLGTSFFFSPIFQARVSFLPSDPGNGSKFQSLAAQLGGLGNFLPGSSERSPTEQLAIILQSRTLADKLLKRVPALPEVLLPKSCSSETSDLVFQKNVLTNLIKSMSVLTPYKSKPIELSIELTNATMTAQVANEYMNVLASHIQENILTQASKNRVYIEDQSKKNQAELVTAEEALKDFQVKHQLVSITTQTENAMRFIGELKAKLMTKEIERDILLKSTTRISPEIKRLDDEIATLKAQVSRLEEGTEQLVLGMKEKDFSKEAQLLKSSLASAPQLILDYYRLKRTVDAFQKVYEFLTQQLMMAKIQEQMETPSFIIIDPAETPLNPIRPRRWNFSVVGGFCGFFFALAVLVFKNKKLIVQPT